MRAAVTAILLCLLLQACGCKGALVLPADDSSKQQPKTSKQK